MLIKTSRLPKVREHLGLVAILDALGASTFNREENQEFIKSRARALKLLDAKLDVFDSERINRNLFSSFTFNDTVLFTLKSENPNEVNRREILAFFLLLRSFFFESLDAGILFRGSISIGKFLADDESNTVLGSAVTDAAAWYDRADWIGLITTPRTTLELRLRQEAAGDVEAPYLCVDYDVPLCEGRKVMLKAIDWRKIFNLSTPRRRLNGDTARAWFLKCLLQHNVPAGTESKYTNSLAFFDYCQKLEQEEIGQ